MGGAKGWEGVCGGLGGGGGLKCFFSGPKFPPSKVIFSRNFSKKRSVLGHIAEG